MKENKLTNSDWKYLEKYSDSTKKGQKLLLKTEKEYEHPNEYEGPCYCYTCMQYS